MEEVSHGPLGLEIGSDRDNAGLVILQIKAVESRRGLLLELDLGSASLLSELRNESPVSSPNRYYQRKSAVIEKLSPCTHSAFSTPSNPRAESLNPGGVPSLDREKSPSPRSAN